jgi:hypothetical protein
MPADDRVIHVVRLPAVLGVAEDKSNLIAACCMLASRGLQHRLGEIESGNLMSQRQQDMGDFPGPAGQF